MIFGKVQGVGFRAFSRREAIKLGLFGWTRNLSDGRVEILAIGEEQNLEKFEKILRKGPIHARVDKLEVKITSGIRLQNEADFILIEDGESIWRIP